MRLKNKLAVITGAARGIGFAAARRLGQEGAALGLVVHHRASGEEARAKLRSEGLDAHIYECDLSSKESVAQLTADVVAQQGCPDILINNAAVYITGDFLELSDDDFSRTMDVNVTAVFRLCQSFGRHMVKRGKGGSIINIGSIAAKMAAPRAVIYAGSKGAVHSLTSAMAIALAPHQIRVNAIAPGTIATELTRGMVETPALSDMVLSRTPAGRFGTPEDIAGVAAFLAGDDAAFVTGQIIFADGGRSASSFTVPLAKK